MTQPSLFPDDPDDEYPAADFGGPLAEGARAADACRENAERQGWDSEAAAQSVLAYLRAHGPTSGEDLVTHASRDNEPHDARAFGAVFMRLSRRGLIVKCGYAARRKGHGTHGAIIWALANAEAA